MTDGLGMSGCVLLLGLLFQVDNNLHRCLAVCVDKLVSVVILLKGEAVADERLEVDDALRHEVDGGLIVFMTIHH